MLFKTKQKDMRPFPGESSRPPRYVSVTRVSINGFEGEAVLRNVSTGGFRMESRTYVTIAVGEHYVMWIKPESASGLEPFELEVEVRWVQSTENKFSSGFLIVKYPSDGSIDKYIRYVKDHTDARSITA
ncbi:MAG: PilZ domain-containing protein [Treponema sp.]|jgi:hypothetical protein|nr:PilZ domain-containing protein [Treponema sp.]